MTAEVNVPDEAVPTADDTRRALEALGFQRGTDRNDMTRAALDAYSVVFEPSRKWQMDHEHALLAAVAAVAGLFVAAELEEQAEYFTWWMKGGELAPPHQTVDQVLDIVAKKLAARAAELRGESR